MHEDDVHVLSANEAFYDAFATRDYERMDGLWARERQVTCIHPGWSVLVGRGPVMASWHAILRSDNPRIEATAARAYVTGDVAYVACFEGPRGESPILVATKVFVGEDDARSMVLHRAGHLASSPEMEITGRTN